MVRTRFAPSPTGYLHIGGVRTALFNWLFARRHGGQFLLRIDDTDQQRNVEAALAPILHGFRWLGLDWDEGPEVGGPHAPYYQSQRLPQYQAAVARLLASGHAYRDFATAEDLQAEREEAERSKQSFIYSRRWMAETEAQAKHFEAEGRQGVVRLKMPREGKLVIPDLIRGDVEFDWAREQDHVIQRADGTCLYHLASVVDDYDFEITHVIRAEEHLSNTPRQIFIAQSLGYALPAYAHLPYVAEPGSKNKLSKRKLDKYLKNPDFARVNEHGLAIAQRLGLTTAAETFNPVIVDFYEQVGYLPDAIINYLLLLGWSLDGSTEFLTRQEMIDNFSLERVNRAPASFDPKKLQAFQDHYMQQLPLKQKVAMVLPYLQRAGFVTEPPPCSISEKLQQLLTAAGDRIKVAGDVLNYDEYFVTDEQLVYDDKAFDKRVRAPGAVELLEKYRAALGSITETKPSPLVGEGGSRSEPGEGAVAENSPHPAFGHLLPEGEGKVRVDAAEVDALPIEAKALDRFTHEFVTAQGIQIGDIIHALRVAVTGKAVGIGLFDGLALLGREHSLCRLDQAIARAKG